MTMWDTVQSNP